MNTPTRLNGSAFRLTIIILFTAVFSILAQEKTTWQPADGPLMTRWAKEVNPQNAHPEYPRPQMVRDAWKNLNGLWQYAVQPKDENAPAKFDGSILVPFPIESALSGVAKKVGVENKLWYKRTFDIPENWLGKRVLLHFGAVDWQTTVWVNDIKVGQHKGGYSAFSFDITDALKGDQTQTLVVSVWDPTDASTQPRGKQVDKPQSIWYTSVTGIWQTVWLETVSEAHIQSFKIDPDIDKESVTIKPVISGTDNSLSIKAIIKDGDNEVASLKTVADKSFSILIKNPKLWTPDDPFLYDLELVLIDAFGKETDHVKSYFAMRKISLGKDEQGLTRLMLNNQFIFQFGLLDQGWWPDGLYTAPTDEALRYDIEITKKLGYNLARKHVKVEPDRWYYWCDKLGLLVWQDMPSGDKYISGDMPDIQRSAESAAQYELELNAMITGLYNHPSIVIWVPYNEGWGQWDTGRITNLVRSWNPTRLVNSTSGWTDRGTGDMHDIHSYPGPDIPEPEENRAIVLGEFGGLGLPLEGHTWQAKDNWGYRSFKNQEDLTNAYTDLIVNLEAMKARGLSAAVYTQTTDVEIEVNGLMTYDRAIIKMSPDKISKINQGYVPPVFISDGDIFLDDLSVELKSSKPGTIYYTLDGSEPSEKSAVFTNPIPLKNSATIRARTCFENSEISAVTQHSYSKVTLLEAVDVKELKPGLKYGYYENNGNRWDQLPDFSELKAKTTGIAESIDLDKAEREENFGLVLEGFFKAPVDGMYSFYSTSDDGSKIYIASQEVVSNDFLHGMEEQSGKIALKAGYHPIKITFFQGEGGEGLEAHFKAPDRKKKLLKDELYYTE